MSAPRIVDAYPLSATQRGMLFHSLYRPDSGVYVVQLAFTLHGPLDPAAFDAAWQGLAARHEVLRTAFAWDKLAAPLQIVGAAVRLPVRIDPLDAADRDTALRDWMDADRRQGFRLSAAPLMRVQAFRLADEVHRVICTHHHILLDGWSLPLLLRDWHALYAAACAGRAADLPPAPRYRTYIDWLARQDRTAALNFWQAELAGCPTPGTAEPDAPTDAGCAACVLDAARTGAVNALARRMRVTPGTVIQGAWALLRARLTGRGDLVFGLTRSGRPPALTDSDATVGLFITTLPMRVRIDARQPLADWLPALQARQLAQQPHEHLAQADLPATRGLYDSIVVIENYPLGERPAGHGALRLSDAAVAEMTHYPLSLFAVAGDTLELKLLHDRARFTDAQAQDMLNRLSALLQAFCAQADGALSDFDPYADAALAQAGLSRTAQPQPAQTTAARIAFQAAATPQAIAVRDADGAIDYATLQARADALAARLHARGIGRGDIVALCCARSRELVIALLAVLRSGAAWLPLDPTHPPARLREVLEDSGARALLLHLSPAHPSHLRADAFWSGDTLAVATPAADLLPGRGKAASSGDARLEDPAYLIYTSGSTGKPKGVLVSQLNLANLLQSMAERLALTSPPHWLAVTTPTFDIAALELLLPLYCGGSVFVADEDTVRDGHALAALLAREAITHLQATPAGWRLLLAAGWRGQRGLAALCGGETLDSALARDLLSRVDTLWNVYGPTETTIWSAALNITPDLLDGAQAPIGHALNNTSLHVLDAQGRPVPPGEAGELLIGGIGVAAGYHRQPALTAERFVPNALPRSGDAHVTASARLYRTGDRVRLRADGLLDCLGRDDRQIKLRGYRIELDEIEAVLRAQPAVEDAAVVLQGTAETVRLAAFYTGGADADAVRRGLADTLPAWMLPSSLHVLAALPRTPNGKTDRRALQTLEPAATVPHPGPASNLERQLLALWRSVLGREAVGVHDNFFEAGGHSLLAITVQSRLKSELAAELPLVELFQHPTVAALAAHIEAMRRRPDTPAAASPDAADDARAAGRQRLNRRRMQQANGAQVNG